VLDDGSLQRLQYPVMDPDQDTRIIRQNLLTDVESVDIELKRIDDGREEVSDTWDEQSRLPDLLEMSILFESGIEYNRSFSMLNGDTLDAIAAAQSAGLNSSNDSDSDADSDADQEDLPIDEPDQLNELLPDEDDLINQQR